VKYRAADLKRARQARRETRGESAIDDAPTDEALEAIWEAERRRSLMQQALEEIRKSTKTSEKTMAAFEMYVVKQMPIEAVASQCQMTPHDVYMAKNRIAERLRTILTRLDRLFDDG